MITLRPGRIAVWGLTLLAYPVGGLLAEFAVGPIQSPLAALGGGALVGLAVGVAQSLASARRLAVLPWTLATVAGSAIGLLAGSAAIGYSTEPLALVAMGAITGLGVGIAQALVLRTSFLRRLSWAAAMPLVLGAAWFVTAAIGVDIERQYASFGSSGALLATVATGLLLWWATGSKKAEARS